MSKHLLYIVTTWCCCSRGLLLVRLVSVGLLTGSLLLCGGVGTGQFHGGGAGGVGVGC